jgi:amino acid adenylation domain-containing protein
MSDTFETIAALSDEKRALLELLLKNRGREAVFPLSSAQKRFWFMYQLDSEKTYHNIPGILRISGQVNAGALQKALNEIIKRHEILRTTIQQRGNNPVQVVAPTLNAKLEIVELSALPDCEKKAFELASVQIQKPFDLVKGPLLRASLLKLACDDCILVLVLHHIITDGWSMAILVREMTLLYQAYVDGRPSSLAPLHLQYGDYAAWQQNWLQTEGLRCQLAYWTQQLAEAPAGLELVTDRPRALRRSMRSLHYVLPLERKLVRDLAMLTQRERVTQFMVLLTAYATVLLRHSGQEDIVIGAPIANRNRKEIEDLIGLFINMLPLRCDLSGNPTLKEALRRARLLASAAFAHQDVPVERVIEELHPERTAAQTPLFQVVLTVENTPSRPLSVPGLSFRFLQPETGVLQYEMLLALEQEEQSLALAMEYQEESFDRDTIVRMMDHIHIVLHAMVNTPEQTIREIPLLSEVERNAILNEWNHTQAQYPRELSLAELVEQQVSRSPQAVALRFEGQQLTYEEMNCRANQLAHYLVKMGLRREELVGLCLARSLEMMIGVLAVLKAGGAYVPLDPSYPLERLRYMARDTGARFLLTQERLLGLLQDIADPEGRVVCIDREWPEVARESRRNSLAKSLPDSLAYVIYTSGSTGLPKGVMIEQRSILNRLWWAITKFEIGSGDAVLQKTPFSFDASVWEMLAPLLAGGCVVIARPGGQQDSRYLVDTVTKDGITVLQLVPSMLALMLQEPGVERCGKSLEWLFSGGEALTAETVEVVRQKLPDVKLVNLYGPTEASIDVSSWPCEQQQNSGYVPLGHPISNAEIYIVDQFGILAPVGVVGEIYAGGVGLARGYWNRADLTAVKFIPDGFSGRPGARLYRTGDLGRYRHDGVVEYLRRADQQVKLRGYRIELGEIESVLSACEGVKEAAVLVREDEPGIQQLVAYVVLKQHDHAEAGSRPDGRRLKERLRLQLPEYMVPALVVELEAMPRTSSGKVDRKTLPKPKEEPRASRRAPRTGVQELLAQIWADVLKVDHVSREDSFFESGGHSLLAIQLISRIREVFQVELPLRTVFERPTLDELSSRIESKLGVGPALSEPIRPRSPAERHRLSYAQQGIWLMDQLQPGNTAYNLPAAIYLKGNLDAEALRSAVQELVQRHEVLRTQFTAGADGEPEQTVLSEIKLEMRLIEVSGASQEEKLEQVRRCAMEETQKPFDLAKAPLFRARLLRLGQDEHVVLFVMHHIITDGWSQAVMVQEISAIYAARVAGESVPLEELPIQYADYAAWERDRLESVLEKQRAYWQRQLNGIGTMGLPTDRARVNGRSNGGDHYRVLLPDEDVQKLNALARRHHATLFMALLAVFRAAMWRSSGATDVPVGTSIANRGKSETEKLIGLFLNTLVLRTRLNPDESFLHLLANVRETALGAYTHQDVPFEILIEDTKSERSAHGPQLFEVMFVMENTPVQNFQLPGVNVSLLDVLPPSSKYALTLFVEDEQGSMSVIFEYDTDLFERATIESMGDSFVALLRALCDAPDRPLAALPMPATQQTNEMVEAFLESIE